MERHFNWSSCWHARTCTPTHTTHTLHTLKWGVFVCEVIEVMSQNTAKQSTTQSAVCCIAELIVLAFACDDSEWTIYAMLWNTHENYVRSGFECAHVSGVVICTDLYVPTENIFAVCAQITNVRVNVMTICLPWLYDIICLRTYRHDCWLPL